MYVFLKVILKNRLKWRFAGRIDRVFGLREMLISKHTKKMLQFD
ncbi:hypothetical protein AO385_0879 [Moraxella catarrhalis]|uniref:Uncharacterized protein n=1 Tax=Moraxella catarrhalis TaxID=480 RepID=A0A198UDW4_MORCA|nr:hypothetical protein AO384_1963 [Moraxella catarrhalis]OAU98721.1 hypothetical protein AO383_0510 [Moraxella catarrhalis]OAV02761.1 hypothetical protein AO385_0879 [Moraxella catarrhalis]